MRQGLTILLAFFIISCFSQQTVPANTALRLQLKQHGKTALTNYLNKKKWNALFPNRHGIHAGIAKKSTSDFYSFDAFVSAAKYFPDFISGSADNQKQELAAFLANIAQETSGGWAEAPGGYFKWGLYFVEEKQDNIKNVYADFNKKNYPPVSGKSYFGRGPKQLSWNYNYGQFSEAWFGSKDSLLQHPEWLAQDPVLSFASAIWFWMTPQFPKPSCHDIMSGKWNPTPNDLEKGRVPGFGATVNVINGGVECGTGTDMDKTAYRYQYYTHFCRYFQVSPGKNISCSNQKPFGQ
ncbi:MAG: chitinase [Paludibacter sp.]